MMSEPDWLHSIWAQMGYPVPRGGCDHKPSLLSPSCPCLRFMLHPLKAKNSFQCDGCGHHASFHQLENRAEDEIARRWHLAHAANKNGPTTRPQHNAGVSHVRPPHLLDLRDSELDEVVGSNPRKRQRRIGPAEPTTGETRTQRSRQRSMRARPGITGEDDDDEVEQVVEETGDTTVVTIEDESGAGGVKAPEKTTVRKPRKRPAAVKPNPPARPNTRGRLTKPAASVEARKPPSTLRVPAASRKSTQNLISSDEQGRSPAEGRFGTGFMFPFGFDGDDDD